MKKKILVLAMVLALLALMAPTAVLADNPVVTGTIASVPVVTSVLAASGNPGEALDLVITGSDFQDIGPVVTMTGPGLTISGSAWVNATTINFHLVIAAGAGATRGTRDVIVTQGAQVGIGSGIFTVNTVSTITAPSGFALGYMTAALSPIQGSSGTGSIVTNGTTYVVLASDTKVVNPGYMTKVGDVNTKLHAYFQISKVSSTVDLANSDTGITYALADAAVAFKFYCSQVIGAIGVDVPNAYTITITYAVSTQ